MTLRQTRLHDLEFEDRGTAWYSVLVLVDEGHTLSDALALAEYDYGLRETDPDLSQGAYR
jgi:hypothetical protein